MPQETWAGLLTLGDTHNYNSKFKNDDDACYPPAIKVKRDEYPTEAIFTCFFLFVCFFLLLITAALFMSLSECVNEERPYSTSENNMENSHGNTEMNRLQQLSALKRDF